MKNKILICGILILLFIGLSSADNGRDGRNETTTTTTTLPRGTVVNIGIITNESVTTNTDINTNGSVTVLIDGTNILQNKGDWSDDKAISTLIMMLRNGIGEMNGGGKAAGLTGSENALMYYLITMTDLEIEKFYYSVLAPQLADLGGGVSSNRRLIDENTGRAITNYQIGITNKRNIQMNQYEIEAFKITLEKTHPEIYCESRMDVMNKYGFDRVKCGLASKKCYNGDIYDNEGGRDFCVDLDHPDFPGCYVEDGQCGHIEDIEVGYDDHGTLLVTVAHSSKEDVDVYAEIDEPYWWWDNIYGWSREGRTYFEGKHYLDVGEYSVKITTTFGGVKEVFETVTFTVTSTTTTTIISPSTTTTTIVDNPGVVSRAFSFDGGGLLMVGVLAGILAVVALLLTNGIVGNLRKKDLKEEK